MRGDPATPRGFFPARRALGAALLALAWAATACAPGPTRPVETVHVAIAPPSDLPPQLQRGPQLNGRPLRVLLRRSAQGLKVSAPGGLRLRDPESGRILAELAPKGHARLGSGAGQLHYNGHSLGLGLALIEPLVDGEAVKVAGRRYRGFLALRADGVALQLINVVGIEDYLKGVLPSEIPSKWPLEAQKAQAIAARSFALAHLAKGQQGWDVDDSTSSQVYKGLDAEAELPSRAVEATRGLVLAYHGQVIEAFFHSNSGGHTADAAEVWGGSGLPYLLGVLDSASEDQEHYRWQTTIPMAEAERLLHKAGLWSGLLEDVIGRERSESGRWSSIELVGREDRRTVKANAFRLALGADRIRSTRFDLRLSDDSLRFNGLGWGHGVGLSQEGALVQAQHGWDARRILEHYYPGARLASVEG